MPALSDPAVLDLDGQAAGLVATLTRRGETVAAAESLTAGLVCATLARISGASAVLRGGLVVYATELKHSLAGVDEALLAARGAVDPEVAAQLAAGARDRCGATWGLGLTGVAGPSGQDGAAPGTVHIGLSGPFGQTVRTLLLSGDRDAVRTASVNAAFTLLEEQLD
ncbi:CinA family protein [Amycolatopsis sp. NBC_00345]|uniref:CinA family protein n=1 Tax=Amycolatopsis sp. NBC_00345 TaxID=2975955 RepID=UPI002E255BB6